MRITVALCNDESAAKGKDVPDDAERLFFVHLVVFFLTRLISVIIAMTNPKNDVARRIHASTPWINVAVKAMNDAEIPVKPFRMMYCGE